MQQFLVRAAGFPIEEMKRVIDTKYSYCMLSAVSFRIKSIGMEQN